MKESAPVLITLPSGLRLVCLRQKGARAGIFGIAVRAGSADEEPGLHGLAHFVEHTIFKGTAKRSSWHIINRMEAVGGELNAFTTKEETVLYTIFPGGCAARGIELIADLAVNSRFPDRELDKEREVVIDEINSYRDTPSEAIYDDFEELAFAGTPLAHNILGTPGSVRDLGSEHCRAFLDRYYTTPNVVAFYSGPRTPESIAALVERHFEAMPRHSAPKRPSGTCKVEPFERTERLDTHQCHTLLGASVPGIGSPQRHAVALFANIIGGPGMNSLLNVELRERRGLVYSVEASTAMFTGGGLLNVYYGCDAADSARCRRICSDTFSRLADSGLSPRSLAAARKQYLGQLALASENRENRIMALARATLFRGAPSSAAEITAAIEAVDNSHISAIAQAMLGASALSFTY
ncbi:MAG: insulinase family protein [Muribaculaceae bacterium]|nr:insulinase family protein [Muribaculaceae bacterium]